MQGFLALARHKVPLTYAAKLHPNRDLTDIINLNNVWFNSFKQPIHVPDDYVAELDQSSKKFNLSGVITLFENLVPVDYVNKALAHDNHAGSTTIATLYLNQFDFSSLEPQEQNLYLHAAEFSLKAKIPILKVKYPEDRVIEYSIDLNPFVKMTYFNELLQVLPTVTKELSDSLWEIIPLVETVEDYLSIGVTDFDEMKMLYDHEPSITPSDVKAFFDIGITDFDEIRIYVTLDIYANKVEGFEEAGIMDQTTIIKYVENSVLPHYVKEFACLGITNPEEVIFFYDNEIFAGEVEVLHRLGITDKQEILEIKRQGLHIYNLGLGNNPPIYPELVQRF